MKCIISIVISSILIVSGVAAGTKQCPSCSGHFETDTHSDQCPHEALGAIGGTGLTTEVSELSPEQQLFEMNSAEFIGTLSNVLTGSEFTLFPFNMPSLLECLRRISAISEGNSKNTDPTSGRPAISMMSGYLLLLIMRPGNIKTNGEEHGESCMFAQHYAAKQYHARGEINLDATESIQETEATEKIVNVIDQPLCLHTKLTKLEQLIAELETGNLLCFQLTLKFYNDDRTKSARRRLFFYIYRHQRGYVVITLSGVIRADNSIYLTEQQALAALQHIYNVHEPFALAWQEQVQTQEQEQTATDQNWLYQIPGVTPVSNLAIALIAWFGSPSWQAGRKP